MKESLRINELDNVQVTLVPIGEIPAGHKIALCDIPKDAPIIKYGNVIGYARCDISKGEWVHVHNVRTGLSGKIEYSYEPVGTEEPAQRASFKRTEVQAGTDDASGCRDRAVSKPYAGGICRRFGGFMGYVRKSGEVGTRNEIWIIPTVGCVNHVAEALVERCEAAKPSNVDAVVAMIHPYGCSQMGDDQEHTAMILGRLAGHPNCGGALILSLGCENNNLEHMKPYLQGIDADRIRTLVCQETEDELAEGERLIGELYEAASEDVRTECPIAKLTVGLKCGGSDGFSGITANPLVGMLSDIVTDEGGTTILTEVPEMFGAEQLLMNRAESKEVFEKTVALINDFKDYYERHNQVIYENPSPGNKAGGITTLEDKSLGCVQKSGSARVRDVLKYGQKVVKNGLNLLEGPGNDMVAVTALAAAGATVILFTTGRGTPLSSPVPTVKISSNSVLAEHKTGWIDFDAGRLVSTDIAAGQLTDELMDYVLEVASGRYVRSEEAGYHSMTIFKQGVTL